MKSTKSLTLKIPLQIELLARFNNHSVEDLLNTFMADLGHCIDSSGSDERTMAQAYYERTSLPGSREQTADMLSQFDGIRGDWSTSFPAKAADKTGSGMIEASTNDAYRQQQQTTYDAWETEQLTAIENQFLVNNADR